MCLAVNEVERDWVDSHKGKKVCLTIKKLLLKIFDTSVFVGERWKRRYGVEGVSWDCYRRV